MKIYNKIIYDINDNIIYEDSYDYQGKIAKCDVITDTAEDILGSDIGQIALTIAVAVYAPTMVGALTGMGVNPMLARVIVSVGSSMVLGAVGKALAPKIDQPNFGTSLQQGVTVTSKSPTQPYRIIYGETRVGGTLVYAQTTSETNEYLHLVIVLAGHEVSDMPTIYFNDDVVALETTSNDSNGIPIYTPTSSDQYKDKAIIKKHFGDNDQSADANLVADVTQWTTAHKINGKAYLYLKFTFDSDVYPNGVPNVSAIIKGKKLYDPRATSFTASSSTVSTSANTITLSSHGLSTFDRATYDTNSNTAIGGLSNGSTYYVIKVDANTIKLATNYTNCLAGTPISLTSVSGSTTQKFNFTTFTSNPALQIRDYLSNSSFGMKAEDSELNDTNFSTTANTCDENVTVTNPSGTEKRFTGNGSFLLSQSPKVIIENLLTTMGGFLVYSNGTFKLVPATYPTPTVYLNESHLRSGLQVNTRISKKELFNAVKGVYSEPANDYQPQNYPFLTSSAFESEDNSERIYGTFDYPFTNSSRTCQRLSKIQLLKARQQISFSTTLSMEAFQLNVGDTVYISNARFGWTNKTFQIVDWNFQPDIQTGNLLIAAEFREIASAVYDFATSDYSTISSGKATNLPKSTSVSPPTAITLTDELVAYNDGTVIVKLVIELTEATDNFTELYEIEIKQDTDANGTALSPADSFKEIGRGSLTKYEFLNVIDKATYSVRARGVNIFGVNSSTITASRTIIGQIAPPSDVENFACNIVGKEAHLSFDPVPDLDLSHYRINYSPATSNAEWQNSIVLVKKLSRPGTSIVVPAKTGTYLIKAVDKLGNVSINATQIVTQITTIGDFTDLITQNENPNFLGTNSDTVISFLEDGSKAIILKGNQLFDDVSGNFDSITQTLFDGGENATVKSSGTYAFSDTIDAGAIITTQITATLEQQVTDRARIFDFVSGNFDDQPSNFDGDANTQCSSELQISVSNDNSTFSAFQDFTIGDYSGRYFKFRVLLTSNNGTATPIVTAVGVVLRLESFVNSQNDLASGTGTKSVTYPKAFRLLNSIAITLSVQNMASGDKYAITSKSTTGFNIAFQNSGGSGVSRTFDYQSKGV